jgi:preprotein translocase subunit SecF
MGLGSKLYNGETRIDFVGRTKLWFAISGAVILLGLVSLGIRGLNLGIDFEGGVVWEFPAADMSVEDARDAMADLGVPEVKVQTLSTDDAVRIRIQAEPLGLEREQAIAAALAEATGAEVSDVSLQSVGPSWGQEITEKALRALIVFLVAITLYVTLRFEFKMALATLAALVHDILVTLGVYSLTGFEVTPATVIAILTILGYSIYDGIVVFDKVDENTRLVSSTNRVTYSDMVNLSLNQTLMRSLNTSITALIPIASLLIVGSFILGATTLQEFALALLIGLASGAYSSIFIASPLLAILKEREPRFRDVRRRIEARGGSAPVVPEPAIAATGAAALVAEDETAEPAVVGAQPAPAPGRPAASPSGVIPPRPRKKTRRR